MVQSIVSVFVSEIWSSESSWYFVSTSEYFYDFLLCIGSSVVVQSSSYIPLKWMAWVSVEIVVFSSIDWRIIPIWQTTQINHSRTIRKKISYKKLLASSTKATDILYITCSNTYLLSHSKSESQSITTIYYSKKSWYWFIGFCLA